jgi:hypothetical protein
MNTDLSTFSPFTYHLVPQTFILLIYAVVVDFALLCVYELLR